MFHLSLVVQKNFPGRQIADAELFCDLCIEFPDLHILPINFQKTSMYHKIIKDYISTLLFSGICLAAIFFELISSKQVVVLTATQLVVILSHQWRKSKRQELKAPIQPACFAGAIPRLAFVVNISIGHGNSDNKYQLRSDTCKICWLKKSLQVPPNLAIICFSSDQFNVQISFSNCQMEQLLMSFITMP